MFKISLYAFIALGVFVAVHLYLPIDLASSFFDNFNKVAIGVAALITSYFGSAYFLEEIIGRKRIDSFRKRFPYDKYETTWDIIVREDRLGEPHVLNLETSEIHHLWNMKTVFDLGWQFYPRKPVSTEVWNTYKRGDQIRTRGELGE